MTSEVVVEIRMARDINAELSRQLAPLHRDVTEQLRRLEEEAARQRIRENREFSWMLFPEALLRDFYEATFAVNTLV